jgi:hypothetical protein
MNVECWILVTFWWSESRQPDKIFGHPFCLIFFHYSLLFLLSKIEANQPSFYSNTIPTMRKNRLQLFMPFLLIISFFFCLLTVAADVLRSQPQLHGDWHFVLILPSQTWIWFWSKVHSDSFDEFLRSSGSMENRAEDRVDDSDEGQPFGIQQQGGGRRGAEGGGGMRGMMAEEKPVPSAPGDERDKELRESPAAAIRGLDLENFCFGNGDAFPLGPCSSTFLKCGRFNAVRRFTFEECPLGNVFVGKECGFH